MVPTAHESGPMIATNTPAIRSPPREIEADLRIAAVQARA